MTAPRRLAVVLTVLALASGISIAGAREAEPAVSALSVQGSPLILGSGSARMSVDLVLERPVDDLDLRIEAFGGRTIRQLADGPQAAGTLSRSWNGRDGSGQAVPMGAYRVVADVSTEAGTQIHEAWVTVAHRRIYPRRPGFITVAIDAGHDAVRSGAVAPDGTREADLNLDIARRLARMLEGAGVNVAMTREANVNVNEPPVDLTGDGVIDDTDELAARPDIANVARADLYISVHNNIAVNRNVGGPSTFHSDARPFSDRSAQLARHIQSAMVRSLSRFADASWSPHDHGVLVYPYYVLRGYDPPRLQRPTQMPGVLSEGLFLSNPRELRMLKRPVVRQAIAEAYYDAVATYLARRSSHVGYELLAAPPAPATAGEPVTFEVEVRNQGNEPMRGWSLAVGALPAQPHYEGRGRTGRLVGTHRIPRLRPGERVSVEVEVTAPDPGRDWLLLFDARERDGRRASRRGSPVLQVPFSTVDPPPSASPSVAPSPDPDDGDEAGL